MPVASPRWPFFTTFVAVLVLPVAAAVGAGVAVSLLLQLNQDALDLRVVRLSRRADGSIEEGAVPRTVGPRQTLVLDVHGSLFYAGSHTLQRRLPVPTGSAPPDPDRVDAGPVVILRLRGRPTLGATFLKVIGEYAHQIDAASGRLYLTGVDPDLMARWQQDQAPEQLSGVRLYAATPLLGESTWTAVNDARRVVPVPGE